MITKSISAANKLISELYITEPNEHPLEQIVRYCGAHYDEKSMNGADGRIIFRGKEAIIIINNLITNNNKKRFVVAHEIGHLRLHRSSSKFFNCTDQNFIEWKSGSQEAEANEFAAEFLMPLDIFKREVLKCKQDFIKERIISLSNTFSTSLTSTAIRFTTLGNVDAAIFFTQNNQIKWYSRSSSFCAKEAKIKQPIPKKTLASDFFINGQTQDEPRLILPNIWFTDIHLPTDKYFYEQCFYMQSINAVLTIVWPFEDGFS